MLDRLTGMQVFARIASLGSLSAAARALGMSQTMATKHLAALEERLGIRLVHRTTRRLTLTEQGRAYLESVERILGEVEEADALASAARVEAQGVLRVAAPVSFGARHIAPLFAEFARLHPKVTVDLGLNDRFVDLVEEGWDLAVRIGDMKSSTLVSRRLAPCRLVLSASPAYIAAHGRPERTSDLAAHNCLGYTLARSAATGVWAFEKDGRVKVRVSGSLRASNGGALMAAALGGLGILYEPTFLVGPEIRAGRLVRLDLDHPPLELAGIFVVYPSDHRPPAKVRAFVDFLAERLGPNPPWDVGV